MSAASLVAQGYGGYAGWGDAEADADFAATGGSGKWTGGGEVGGGGGGESKSPEQIAQEYANAIIKAQQRQIDEETKFLDQYTAENPFVFDEELARQSATAEYEPYYSDLLQDYLNQMDVKRESLQSDVDLLKELKRYDFGARTRAYNMAVAGAEEGYAGQGMFFSGIRRRGIGQRTVEYKQGLAEQEERYGHQFADYGRQKELYDLEQRQKERDIGEEKEYQIEKGTLQREKEAMAQYYVPLEQSYYRKFPAGTGGTLKGYTVPEYYRV